MRIGLIAPASNADDRPYDFLVGVLAEMGIQVELVDCDRQQPIELGLDLSKRLARNEFDRILVWGSGETALKMRGVAGIGGMIVVPPFGSRWERPDSWWQQFQTHRFLAFSRRLHEQLLSAGARSAHFQYYGPPVAPARLVDVVAERSALLWERQGSTTESILSAMKQCRALGLDRLQVANCAPTAEQDQLEALSPLPGFLRFTPPGSMAAGADLDTLIRLSTCFVAPGQSDGLCPVLLRAIAAGRVVIGPDVDPIRDYVGHLATGILYDPADPLDLPRLENERLRDLAAAAVARSTLGHARWLADTDRLASILKGDDRRWATSDRSAEFGNLIRRRANQAALQRADAVHSRTARSAADGVARKGRPTASKAPPRADPTY